jgi:redox-sensitive bicupin YhaK (pirin superfamily)
MRNLETTTSLRPAVTDEPRSPRSVEGVYRSTAFHWVGDGFHVSSYFPRPSLPAERVSPFLLMDYGPPHDFEPLPRGQRGVGWHPHRGFETVTLAWEGAVAHKDSLGHVGIIGPGDVQWMTAARGILHQEFHEESFARQGGRLHMMQLWVNLPRKHKMDPAGYQPITAAEIPVVPLDGGGQVRVIAGEHAGRRGPARTFTPITMLDITVPAGQRVPIDLPASYNALAVVTRGRVTASDEHAQGGELLLFANDGEHLELIAEEDAHIVLLAGEPIDEPIVQHGPFVMNTQREIYEAILDFSAGRFGEES